MLLLLLPLVDRRANGRCARSRCIQFSARLKALTVAFMPSPSASWRKPAYVDVGRGVGARMSKVPMVQHHQSTSPLETECHRCASYIVPLLVLAIDASRQRSHASLGAIRQCWSHRFARGASRAARRFASSSTWPNWKFCLFLAALLRCRNEIAVAWFCPVR